MFSFDKSRRFIYLFFVSLPCHLPFCFMWFGAKCRAGACYSVLVGARLEVAPQLFAHRTTAPPFYFTFLFCQLFYCQCFVCCRLIEPQMSTKKHILYLNAACLSCKLLKSDSNRPLFQHRQDDNWLLNRLFY